MSVFKNDVFAVVDLETTGTQRENNNHIIQFGCAIVKNMKVVKTYSFMINPLREITLSVKNLTGISDEDVKDQKDFSYYAPKISEILKDTIFVAHNVNFDFPFLNYELVEHGFDPLNIKAIDTVELAKIAFPTLPSYKLGDLTDRLNIKHLDHHRADSDAYGTAVLLIKIIKKIESLPQATLNTLSSLAQGLVRDTSWIFTKIADYYRKQKRPLSKEYMQVRNIILQRQHHDIRANIAGEDHDFPKDDEIKKKLFKTHVNYRKSQVELINHIHQFVVDPNERAMLVEAPNGTGKTFAYLFAYAYQLYSSRKLVIAAPTKVLQNQILEKEIPQLLKITKLDLSAEVVKASSHYIDLDGFVQTIFRTSPNKPTLVLQMQILVWLTETKTGDLDELQLTNYKNPLFTQISHPGDARVSSKFAEVDFWNLARERQESADILVTNHAYLANHYMDTIWGQNPYLVIDEAHRFTDNVISSRNDALRFESLIGVLNHLKNILYYGDSGLIQSQITENVELNFLFNKLDSQILDLIYTINDLQKFLYSKKDQAVNKNVLASGSIELSFSGNELFSKDNIFNSKLNLFVQKLEQVRQLTNQILFNLYQSHISESSGDDAALNELAEIIDSMDYYTEKSYQLAEIVSNKNNLSQSGFVLMVTNPDDPLSSNLHWMVLDVSEQLKSIYSRFDHILFVSATLTSSNNFQYAISELGLKELNPITFIGKSSFDINKHLEVFAIQDMPSPNTEKYLTDLEEILTNDLDKMNHVLVLMTNLEKIHDVFTDIVNNPNLKDFEILAQGITGSNNRIAKRFSIAKRSIIIGADSFWEGIDFHDCGIDLVIATKLPFESPDRPEVKLRQKHLEEANINVFKNDSIPRALIRFKQGMGRLIRGEQDHGKFVILDSRLWSKDYGTSFLDTIPVKVQKIKQKDLKDKLS